MKALLLFLDGVGIGPDDPALNPFLRARLPTFRDLLGGVPTLDRPRWGGPDAHGARSAATSDATPAATPAARSPGTFAARSFPLDATLGVEGLPRSGTGHTALLTGRNAPRIHGHHFGPWVPVALRPLLERENVLVRAREAGRSVTFANAYPPGFLESAGGRRPAGPPLAARAAGVLTRDAADLERGRAVASGIVNRGWREVLGHAEVPEVTPGDAGRNLAAVAGEHDLTLFAHYDTDRAGHRGGMEGAVEALERVDGFLEGLLDALPDDLFVVIASDHGNVEDVSGGHTRNPALGVVFGAGAGRVPEPERITDVAGLLLEVVGVR